MNTIIKHLLQLWDPFSLWSFPDDEYTDFVEPIANYLSRENLDLDAFVEYLLKLITPIDDCRMDVAIKNEYARFAKTLLLINQNFVQLP